MTWSACSAKKADEITSPRWRSVNESTFPGAMAKGLRIPTEQLSEETQQLYDVLNNEKDLAVILIASSFLDACLRSLLEKKLLEGSVSDRMLSHKGVLGGMSARADLCYALGLLPKRAYQDLGAIAEIRNIVAGAEPLWCCFVFVRPKVA